MSLNLEKNCGYFTHMSSAVAVGASATKGGSGFSEVVAAALHASAGKIARQAAKAISSLRIFSNPFDRCSGLAELSVALPVG